MGQTYLLTPDTRDEKLISRKTEKKKKPIHNFKISFSIIVLTKLLTSVLKTLFKRISMVLFFYRIVFSTFFKFKIHFLNKNNYFLNFLN